MGTLKDAFIESIKDYPSELIGEIRNAYKGEMDESVFEERLLSIHKATSALLEAAVPDERIISLLQKYWDLRHSEATHFLQQAKNRLDKK